MIQSKISSPRNSEVLLSPRGGWWQLKFSRMKRFLEEERMDGEKSQFCHPSENINIKEREREEFV